MSTSPTASTTGQLDTSILTETVRLNLILADIAQLNRSAASGALTSPQIDHATESLASRLSQWQSQVPEWLLNTPSNLNFHASLGTGEAFVALHIGYHHFNQLLYYRYLHVPDISEAAMSPRAEEAETYAELCRNSSIASCEIIYNANSTPGAKVYYSMIGHVLVIASTIQLHILLFSNDDTQTAAARARLERNFSLLCELQKLWRVVDISLDRFRSFHDACIKSKETLSGDANEVFRLDQWMVEFLMEFSRPIFDRPRSLAASQNTPVVESLNDYLEPSFDMHQWSVDVLGIDFNTS